ncbi:CapA family protein [Bifidobacterium aquikefiricola]|uniref:CapA family protein n=1 Tax=Bifidobacterium aquikefiricola TaxID=3059038 RepID=A0AB39U546_9BIFI
MMNRRSRPQHTDSRRRNRGYLQVGKPMLWVLAALLAVLAIWMISSRIMDSMTSAPRASEVIAHDAITRQSGAPEPVTSHHGNAPDCPDQDCISILVNGDLLFHPTLWQHFEGPSTAAQDGSAFDFTPLLSPMADYINASDLAICEFETPIAPRGGPYAGYPIFAIPPEVVDAVAKVGYKACTHATNHSWDQGAEGIVRLNDELSSHGIAHTGSYASETDSEKPLVIDSPSGGGRIGLVTGTVSLNAMVPDFDWRVDRLRDFGDSQHQTDIDRAVAKAKKARSEGADVVAMAMHSVQEYLDDADSWQRAEAHALADTGQFDVIYGAGCHCAQPIEQYNGTWIIYGLGNAVTVSAPSERIVNNQGVTARIQFAGKRGAAGSWKVNRIDWIATSNIKGNQYQWCPLSPLNTCTNPAQDQLIRQRISNVIYAMGADDGVVKAWDLSAESTQPQG